MYGSVCQPKIDCNKPKVIGEDHIQVVVKCGALKAYVSTLFAIGATVYHI